MGNDYAEGIERIAEHILHEARRLSAHLSADTSIPESKVLSDALDAMYEKRPVSAQLEHDKRATYWRVRLRLFNDTTGALEADSDPELPPDAPGTAVLRGLPGVAEWAGELVYYFHQPRNEKVEWLDNATAQQKLKSLRPTLSRKKGKATWRVEYKVNSQPWRALIEIEREPA